MNSSYYISEIEKNLNKLGVNPNLHKTYNAAFDERDNAAFIRKLRYVYAETAKLVDAWPNMDALQRHNALRSMQGRIIGE